MLHIASKPLGQFETGGIWGQFLGATGGDCEQLDRWMQRGCGVFLCDAQISPDLCSCSGAGFLGWIMMGVVVFCMVFGGGVWVVFYLCCAVGSFPFKSSRQLGRGDWHVISGHW